MERPRDHLCDLNSLGLQVGHEGTHRGRVHHLLTQRRILWPDKHEERGLPSLALPFVLPMKEHEARLVLELLAEPVHGLRLMNSLAKHEHLFLNR